MSLYSNHQALFSKFFADTLGEELSIEFLCILDKFGRFCILNKIDYNSNISLLNSSLVPKASITKIYFIESILKFICPISFTIDCSKFLLLLTRDSTIAKALLDANRDSLRGWYLKNISAQFNFFSYYNFFSPLNLHKLTWLERIFKFLMIHTDTDDANFYFQCLLKLYILAESTLSELSENLIPTLLLSSGHLKELKYTISCEQLFFENTYESIEVNPNSHGIGFSHLSNKATIVQWHSLDKFEFRQFFLSKPGIIFYNDKLYCQNNKPDNHLILNEPIIYLCSRAGYAFENWYHFTCILMPWLCHALIYCKTTKSILLMDKWIEEKHQYNSLVSELKAKLNPNATIVWINTQKTLLTLNSSVKFYHTLYPREFDSKQHSMLKFFIATTASPRCKVPLSVSGLSRIYLSRSTSIYSRSCINQDFIDKVLKDFNFRYIDCAKLSLNDQKELFANAKTILGPTGASWSNIIFCKPPTKCAIWQNHPASLWSDLAKIVNISLMRIEIMNSYHFASSWRYKINEEHLLLFLKSL